MLQKIGVSKALTQDITLLIAIAFISFIFGILVGRRRLITILINIYVALALIWAVPASFWSDGSMKVYAFLIVVIALTIFGKELFDIYMSGSGTGFLSRVFAMSFLEVVLIFSVIFYFLPEKTALEWISREAYGYLTDGWFRFAWTLAPLVFLFVIHKKINR